MSFLLAPSPRGVQQTSTEAQAMDGARSGPLVSVKQTPFLELQRWPAFPQQCPPPRVLSHLQPTLHPKLYVNLAKLGSLPGSKQFQNNTTWG